MVAHASGTRSGRSTSARGSRAVSPSPEPPRLRPRGPVDRHPFYLSGGAGPVFAYAHLPAGVAPSGTGVLICPPWGWDEVTSYRARRAWADRLAAAGHVALRIDFPGSGDSAGTPADPDLVSSWRDAAAAAARWLRDRAGCERVAVLGLGMGGLIAGLAVDQAAPADDLILWGTPTTGRSFMREARAFGSLQGSRATSAGGESTALPEGSLEIGGFVLSAETIRDLSAIDLTRLDLGRLQRALLLERDGIAVDASLERHLAGNGVAVTTSEGPGWGAMCFHPERYAPPTQVFEAVDGWLAAAPPKPPSDGSDGVTKVTSDHSRSGAWSEPEAATLDEGGAAIRETPIVLDLPTGELLGILSEPTVGPDDAGSARVCAVFLNAGAVRRIGPNRLWVEAARRWAAQGITSFRVDLEGIGDADGDAARFVDVGEFYTEAVGGQVGHVLDTLESRGAGDRFVLVGLCSGAYWAFHHGERDRRVSAAFLLNPRALIWDTELETRRAARRAAAITRRDAWARLIRGEIAAGRVRAVARAVTITASRVVAETLRRATGRVRGERRRDPMDATLDRLRDVDTRVVLAFSGGEILATELEADGLFGRLGRWPNVVRRDLPGRDHTVRPIVAQNAVLTLLDEEMADERERSVHPRSIGSAEEPADIAAVATGSLRTRAHRTTPGVRRGIDAQRRANDRLWKRSDLVKPYANRNLRPVEVLLLVRYRDDLSGRVLELGCGAGRLTGYIAEIAASTVGMDISAAMVSYCRDRYRNATFEVGDLRDVSRLAPAELDVIVAGFSVIDVLDDAQRRSVLAGMRRALRPGGLLIMSTHNLANASHRGIRDAMAARGFVGRAVAMLELPTWYRNRRRLAPFERREADYAILNDVSHEFAALHYYVGRDTAARQLAEHGFEVVECLDLDGQAVGPGERAPYCPELHFVARAIDVPGSR